MPDLFAGKMHALVFRKWKSREKGRDWYDFDWYVSHRVKLDYAHLQQRIKDFNGEDMSLEEFKARLKERLSTVNIEDVKTDASGSRLIVSELIIKNIRTALVLCHRPKCPGCLHLRCLLPEWPECLLPEWPECLRPW